MKNYGEMVLQMPLFGWSINDFYLFPKKDLEMCVRAMSLS
jgi:hypothetical protein